MKVFFTKMHGAGNDFVFLNDLSDSIDLTKERLKKLCDRSFGVGADQVIVVKKSREADFRMNIYNADGSQVEMCGNGVRCFAKYILDKKLSDKTEISVETLAGLVKTTLVKRNPQQPHSGGEGEAPEALPLEGVTQTPTKYIKVDMGTPTLEGEDIPVNAKGLILNHKLHLDGKNSYDFNVTCVSMGNPHCVILLDEATSFPVSTVGPEIENHPFFPNRVNVEFVTIQDRKNVIMRVWERGSGETLACGTGACATAVACVLNGKTERKVTVHLKGGDLDIEWDETNDHVYMTGPATTVFEGEIIL